MCAVPRGLRGGVAAAALLFGLVLAGARRRPARWRRGDQPS
jgi:hypothetical protein